VELGVLPKEAGIRHTPNRIAPITTKQILYLTLFQGVGSGVVNFVINFLIAYAMYHNLPNNTIAFSSTLTCIVSDVIVTSFLIPCLTGIIGTLLIRNDLRVGKLVTPIDHRYLDLPIFKIIPKGHTWLDVVKRSVMFGFIGVVVFMPATLVFIYIGTENRGMRALWSYVAFKGYWGGLEAMMLSPILAFISIARSTGVSQGGQV